MNALFEENKLYSTRSTLDKLDIGLSTLNTLVDNGTLPCIRISKRIRKFHGSTLNKTFCEQAKEAE